jgi:hypothetical protein
MLNAECSMRKAKPGVNQLWFNGRVRAAVHAAEQGREDAAIDLLERLATECHQAARGGLTEWHEIQALELLGVELERQDAYAKAAAVYRRVATLRRAALQESGHGLSAALAAAAVASLRAGNYSTGRKLAAEALALHNAYPVPKYDLDFIRRHLRARRSKSRSTK